MNIKQAFAILKGCIDGLCSSLWFGIAMMLFSSISYKFNIDGFTTDQIFNSIIFSAIILITYNGIINLKEISK